MKPSHDIHGLGMKLDASSPHQRAGKLPFAGPLCALGLAGQSLA